ncbi:hypothetical protein KM043_001958 [Ampulex compressa]|nr:hypothetical protein KM043_001958 [Ampulex compressa]
MGCASHEDAKVTASEDNERENNMRAKAEVPPKPFFPQNSIYSRAPSPLGLSNPTTSRSKSSDSPIEGPAGRLDRPVERSSPWEEIGFGQKSRWKNSAEGKADGGKRSSLRVTRHLGPIHVTAGHSERSILLRGARKEEDAEEDEEEEEGAGERGYRAAVLVVCASENTRKQWAVRTNT